MGINVIKANREHACTYCGQAIEQHRTYRRELGRDNRWHMHCPPVLAKDDYAVVLCGHYTIKQLKAMDVDGHAWLKFGKRCSAGIMMIGAGQPVTLVTDWREHEVRTWVPFHPMIS